MPSIDYPYDKGTDVSITPLNNLPAKIVEAGICIDDWQTYVRVKWFDEDQGKWIYDLFLVSQLNWL